MPEIRTVGSPPQLPPVEQCVDRTRIDLPLNAATKRPKAGYRVVFVLRGDQKPLNDSGNAITRNYRKARLTMLPVLREAYLLTIDFDAFKGGRSELLALTRDVCRAAIDKEVKVVGWQIIDGNATAAGSIDDPEML